MTLKDILAMQSVGSIGLIIIVAVLSLVQISKIEINPWTWLARKIGDAINHNVSEQIKALDERVGKVEDSVQEVKDTQKSDRAAVEEDKAINSRIRILRFNEELLRKEKHSKEMFDQTLSDVTNYTHYCDKHPDFENDRAVLAIANIRRVYQERLQERDFI